MVLIQNLFLQKLSSITATPTKFIKEARKGDSTILEAMNASPVSEPMVKEMSSLLSIRISQTKK